MKYFVGWNAKHGKPLPGNIRLVDSHGNEPTNERNALNEWAQMAYAVMLNDENLGIVPKGAANYVRRIARNFTSYEINCVQHGQALSFSVTNWDVEFWIMPIGFNDDVIAVEYFSEEFGHIVIQCLDCLGNWQTGSTLVPLTRDAFELNITDQSVLCIGCGAEINPKS